MLLILATSVLALFLSNKLCNYICPEKMTKIYFCLGRYALHAYAHVYSFIKNIEYIFKRYLLVYKKGMFILINNGHELRECDINQLSVYTLRQYDLILYKELNASTYTYNVLRVDNTININNINLHMDLSNIKFLNINISYNNNNYTIDLCKDNYYITGNILLDKVFIKWYLNHIYGVLLQTNDYVCIIMDNNVNLIKLDSSQYVIINKDDYAICNIRNDSQEHVLENNKYLMDDKKSTKFNELLETLTEFVDIIHGRQETSTNIISSLENVKEQLLYNG